MSMVSSTR